MKNSEKFESYLENVRQSHIRNHRITTFMGDRIFARIGVKFDFKNNKIKFVYFFNDYNRYNRLGKGWLALRMFHTENYHRFNWNNNIDNIAFSITKGIEQVFTGDHPSDQTSTSTKIKNIEPGTKTNLRKKKIKTDRSEWKITVENLGNLKELMSIIKEYKKLKL